MLPRWPPPARSGGCTERGTAPESLRRRSRETARTGCPQAYPASHTVSPPTRIGRIDYTGAGSRSRCSATRCATRCRRLPCGPVSCRAEADLAHLVSTPPEHAETFGAGRPPESADVDAATPARGPPETGPEISSRARYLGSVGPPRRTLLNSPRRTCPPDGHAAPRGVNCETALLSGTVPATPNHSNHLPGNILICSRRPPTGARSEAATASLTSHPWTRP
jgi:hypothetical protein